MKETYTKRLTIRNFTPDDAKDLQKIIISKEASKYAIYGQEGHRIRLLKWDE